MKRSCKGSVPASARAWIGLFGAILIGVGALYYPYRYFYRAAFPVVYLELVLRECGEKSLPPSLVLAVIRTESGFNPDAQSGVPARGLMQITQETFEWAQMRIGEMEDLHFDDLFQSDLNIRYGTAILQLHLDEFESMETALCAYHAGRSRAIEWLNHPEYAPDGRTIESIPFEDTSRYVQKVLHTKQIYERLYTYLT